MAKLSDLPSELVYQIIEYILVRDDQGPHDWQGQSIDADHYRLLDHNGIGPIKSKPRPHLERFSRNPTPRTLPRHFRAAAALQPHASWPGAIPSNHLLPLSLVNRTFRRCAQELLFKNVPVLSRWRAISLLQTLTRHAIQNPSTLPGGWFNRKHRRNAQDNNVSMVRWFDIDYSRLSSLTRHVRSLQLVCDGICSVSKGSGDLFCGIIRSCPLLMNIAISTAVSMDCKDLMLEALSSRPLIKEFVILDNLDHNNRSIFQWNVDDVVGRLFSKWDHLETVELSGLRGPSGRLMGTAQRPIPILNCEVLTLILRNPELDEQELSRFLKNFRHSMRTLEICNPGGGIDLEGFCRILQGSTNPDLECLKVEIDWRFDDSESITSSAGGDVNHDIPSSNKSLLDAVFESPSALRRLKSLSFTGDTATSKLFQSLPDSIVKLAWEDCDICLTAFAEVLSSSTQDRPVLPNLKSCSVRHRWGLSREEIRNAETALEVREAYLQRDFTMVDGSPT
ncbi:hypothetical protein PGT21_013469 [Puccinia graminis f. sp. tritici]|uniref:Uncharacterized protein n=1 Tax=Puccinia graminis f. sp. tritici TaxID=56615 RepID=A0A5B0M721_PUCGR|nr:hypothetical protein PGTUg99_020452 [Puccinia graminis f. sp. tritici]KAA1071634.1 hypothetical protein PGT21_013469 [Puccinia graminis f. sp. tritici]